MPFRPLSYLLYIPATNEVKLLRQAYQSCAIFVHRGPVSEHARRTYPIIIAANTSTLR